MKVLGKGFGLLAAYSLYQFYQSGNTSWGTERLDWGWAGLCLVFGLISVGLRQAADSKAQKALDSAGLVIFEAIKSGKQQHFYLYLRPFLLDDALIERDPTKTYVGMDPCFFNEPTMTFERLLVESLKSSCAVLSLGKTGETIGAARIETSDGKWFDDFRVLSRASRAILMIPGLSAGCIRELKWLREKGLLEKLVLFQPVAAQDQTTIQEHWDKVKNRLAEIGFFIPEFSPKGSIFGFDKRGNLILHSKSIETKSTDLLRALLPILPKNPKIQLPNSPGQPRAKG